MSHENVIVIMVDSLRKDHVGWYGNNWIDTANIDEFAAHSQTVAFENAYPEGLPTIPIRTALFTGQRTLPYRPWQPLEDEDITLASLLRNHEYTTSLVTDTYHMAKPGMNFHQGFDAFTWIRGQEADAYRTAPAEVDLSPHVNAAMRDSRTAGMLEQYLRNTANRDDTDPSEFFAARVMDDAIEWVERNRDQEPFFLWVDSFDPHEPWDPPTPYRGEHTAEEYDGPDLIHPKYGSVDWMTDEQLEYVRGLYAEEVEFVDDQIGRLLNRLRDLDLFEDSLILFLSDHGHPHGDHGSIMKTDDNLYGELLEIPVLINPPAATAEANKFNDWVSGLAQTDDLPVTLLELLGLQSEAQSMHGESLLPVMRGDQERVREAVVTGYHASEHRCVRTEDWSLLVRPEDRSDELYDLTGDPNETTNLIDDQPEKARELASYLGGYFISGDQIQNIQARYETTGTPVDDA